MSNNRKGILLYNTWHYESGSFREPLPRYLKTHDDIELVLSDTVDFGVDDGRRYAVLGGRKHTEGDALPDWCWFRDYNYRLAKHLELMGIPCFPSSEIVKITSDKILSAILLAGIPMPKTWFGDAAATENIEYPVYVKSADGSGGEEVFRVESRDELGDKIRLIEQGEYDRVLIQEAMPTGDDLRVYVLNGEVIQSVCRKCGEGADKANIKYGSEGILYPLGDEELALVDAILKMLEPYGNLGFICCDFLFDEDRRLVFNELNTMPGIRWLERLDDGDIIEDVVRSCVRNLA